MIQKYIKNNSKYLLLLFIIIIIFYFILQYFYKYENFTSTEKAAINVINSVTNMGKSIFKEIDAIMHMGSDFNKASTVNVTGQSTPDEAVTSQTGSFTAPTLPPARV